MALVRLRNAVEAQIVRGWAGALVLIALVLILFTIARAIAAREERPSDDRHPQH
jgi:ABC-type phosphate transport system permease subunit